jgi:hypothetical protein
MRFRNASDDLLTKDPSGCYRGGKREQSCSAAGEEKRFGLVVTGAILISSRSWRFGGQKRLTAFPKPAGQSGHKHYSIRQVARAGFFQTQEQKRHWT